MNKNKEEIISYIKDHPDSKVKIAITDIDGILRGKVVRKDKFYGILEGGFGFCDVVFGWDSADIAYDNGKFTGWHTGYPDAHAVVDLKTFRKIPWENDLPFFLADFESENGESTYVCPRKLLRKIKQESIDMGYDPVFAQEFEWFNFEETSDTFASKGYRDPKPMTPGMFGYSLLRSSQKHPFFNDLFELLEKFDVPLEGLHTETGPGVYEAALLYTDILEAADRAVLFKSSVKEIAHKHGVMASFMAKWNMDLPGCSGHVHQSLWEGDKNVFFDAYGTDHMSELMKSYVAGQLYCLPHILPMLAPNINSFKRLVEGAWAPTTLTWANDNRTTALRVLCGGEKSARLETRVCGSDTNPYLAMSACLASGLYGIKKGLKLEQEETIGNGYEDFRNGKLPHSLESATNNMKVSTVAKELFGEDFVDHFTRTRDWEIKQYAQSVSDWELKRYFEII